MKKYCNIVYDLLPLYVDNTCTDESKALVEEHIQDCESCKQKYEAMNSSILDESMIEPLQTETNIVNRGRASLKVLKRIKRRWTLSVLACILVVPFIWLGANQFRGEGMTYTNVYDYYKAVNFLQALEDENYEKAYSYININYYYEEELPKKLNEVESMLNMEDYLFLQMDGKNYYLIDKTLIPEENIKQFITQNNEWYTKYKQITLEHFYEEGLKNFVHNMTEWKRIGYHITGFSWDTTMLVRDSEHEVNELSFTIHISNGISTFKSNKLLLNGNNKGLFSFNDVYYLDNDMRMKGLLDGLSVW